MSLISIFTALLLLRDVFADVPSLTDNNFKDFMKKNDKVLVEFYAPWCGHCKNLEPEYHAAGAEINDNDGIPAKIVQVDATENQDTAGQYDVQGYPSLKWFEDGKVAEDYDGPRDSAGIISWVKGRVLPTVSKISGKKAADFGKNASFAVVAYVKGGSKKETLYEKACKKLRKTFEGMAPLDIEFGQVTLKKGNGRFYFRRNNFNEEVDGPVELKYEGKMSGLHDYVMKNMWPLITKEVASRTIQGNTGGDGMLFVYEDFPEEQPADLVAVAKQLREEGMVTAYLKEEEASGDFQMETKPSYIFQSKNENSKGRMPFYKYYLDTDEDDTPLADFVAKAKAGDWPKHFKSEDIPDAEGEAVLTLVGKNFEDEVFDENTDTLVEFYAPWCGHCKKFVPVYEKFAKYTNRLYKGKVRVAKVNAVDNEVDADVSGFPTIMFYPGGPRAKAREVIKFEGNRDERDDLIDFIEENSYHLNEGKDEL